MEGRQGREDEWLRGWDETPGIVSVHAEADGLAFVYRRLAPDRLVVERERFRPFVLVSSLELLGSKDADRFSIEELEGPHALRYRVSADHLDDLRDALLRTASARTGTRITSLRELGPEVLTLPPEEQYLVSTGRTSFRGLDYDDVRRLHLDLETTGLDPQRDRIFLVALRTPDGDVEFVEGRSDDPRHEPEILRRLFERIRVLDPDVIENHNLHGFDLPFLLARARLHRIPPRLGREPAPFPKTRGARRGTTPGATSEWNGPRLRFTVGGRELLDTMDAVIRHDFAARDLPGHGLKVVAKHLGLAEDDRERIPGARVHATYRSDPERVRRYAASDVHEAAALGRTLGGAAFALAGMAPRRYERLADAGPATGVLDPMMVRAYLRERIALPLHHPGDGTPHTGAALHLFAAGVAERIVKADVASLYPSLMRQYGIGPSRDELGVLLALVDRLVVLRLDAKRRAKQADRTPAERHTDEAISAAMKIVVNSAYGYLGAVGLTRFSDVHAANEVTRRGRELLDLLCREFESRGMTLLEADTDGVYFAAPDGTDAATERRIIDEVGALLPPLVTLECEGRYAAMLSHEPKNYALLTYDGALALRGVAFRSRRIEPFAEAFLRRAIERLLRRDLAGVRAAYLDAHRAISGREAATFEVSTLVRLSKTRAQYETSPHRELAYDAMIAAGVPEWRVGQRVRVYRANGGRAALLRELEADEDGATYADPRDYDAAHYTSLLDRVYVGRFARSLGPLEFDAVFASPTQPSLFAIALDGAGPRLLQLRSANVARPEPPRDPADSTSPADSSGIPDGPDP